MYPSWMGVYCVLYILVPTLWLHHFNGAGPFSRIDVTSLHSSSGTRGTIATSHVCNFNGTRWRRYEGIATLLPDNGIM